VVDDGIYFIRFDVSTNEEMKREQNRLALGRIIFPATLLMWAIGLFIGVDAQTSTVGSISGTVRDPTGAVVPRAPVVIQEERTGFSRTVVSNDEGFYALLGNPHTAVWGIHERLGWSLVGGI